MGWHTFLTITSKRSRIIQVWNKLELRGIVCLHFWSFFSNYPRTAGPNEAMMVLRNCREKVVWQSGDIIMIAKVFERSMRQLPDFQTTFSGCFSQNGNISKNRRWTVAQKLLVATEGADTVYKSNSFFDSKPMLKNFCLHGVTHGATKCDLGNVITRLALELFHRDIHRGLVAKSNNIQPLYLLQSTPSISIRSLLT